MNVLVAPDSFKGSVSAAEAAGAIALGVKRAHAAAHVECVPMADGGEGTLEALIAATGGRRVSLAVLDPLGREVRGQYGVSGDGRTVVVELAVASGLPLLAAGELDPRVASTFGTGQLIRHAVERSLPPDGSVIICLGGSATNDGGAGLLAALGWRFLDADGRELPPGGAALRRLASIDDSGVPAAVRAGRYLIASDVTNPLLGPRGASATFGPQKGATPGVVAELELALEQYAGVLERQVGRAVRDVPGAGAAGGAAAGLLALLNASLAPGAELVARASGLQGALEAGGWDLVITGEGRLDEQSAQGKVVSHVARLAGAAGVPVVAVAGSVAGDLGELHALGLSAAFSLTSGPMELDAAVRGAPGLLARAAEQVTRLFVAGRPGSG